MSPICAHAVLPLALLCFVATATAQTCGVRNGFRISNSHSGAGSELAVDTGWQTTAPLTTPGSNSNPSPTCTSQGSCTPTSDYGYLNCHGTGTANNCASSGVFLWLDQVPQARFRDLMTVTSSTLPNGAPVQVQFIVTLDGYAQVNDPSPYVQYSGDLTVGPLSLSVVDAPGTTTGTLQTNVGSTTQLNAGLSATLYAYGLLGLGIPPLFGSYDFDLTVRVGVYCLTPGADLTFCSGRAYQPLTAAVQNAGGGCGAGSPVLSATLPVLGQTQTYGVASSIVAQPVFAAFSFGGPVSTPFGACTARVDLSQSIAYLAGVTDVQGGCSFGLQVPAVPGLAGVTMVAQTIVLSPGGPLLAAGDLSNALAVTFGL